VAGESPVICTFIGNTFTCANMVGASIFGPTVNIQASIDSNPFVNTGKTIQVNQINLLQSDLPNLNSIVGGINCTPEPAEVNPKTTNCSGNLPSYYNTFSDTLKMRIASESFSTCTFSGNTFNCINLVTGTSTGLKSIQASIDSNPFVNTGKTIQVNLIELKASDLPTLNSLVSIINCSPDPVLALSNTICSGTLPPNYTPPTLSLQLRIQNQTPSVCTFSGNTFTCNSLASGTLIGSNNIQAAIGPSTYVNTGKSIIVNPIILSQTNIPSLSTITGGINCTPNPTLVLASSTCSGTLPSYYIPPITNLKLRINNQPNSTCTFSNNTFTCSNLNTGTNPGNFPIQGSIGSGAFQNTGSLIQVNPIILSQSLLPTLNNLVSGINCILDPVVVNQTINCSGTLPSTHTQPNGILYLNVINQPSINCSFIGQSFNCNNLPVGSTPAIKNIQAKIGGSSPTNTGKSINVVPIILSQSDIQSLNDIVGEISCNPELTQINSTITCTGTLPTQYTSPSSPLMISIEGSTPVNCIFSSNTFTCSNIPTGSTFGIRNLQASIATNSQTNTGKLIIVQSSSSGDQFLTDNDIINIGTLSINDPFNDIVCGDGGVVSGGFATTCLASIKPGFILPLDFQMGISTTPGGDCLQENEKITCTNVPVINKEGIAILNIRIAQGDIFNTNYIVTVQGTNPNAGEDSTTDSSNIDNQGTPITDAIEDLSRTGAGITIIILTLISIISVTFIYLPQLRKK
ncbi:MAG: hypothetical protein HC932_03420, partial [Thermales bacterium]|nr:hypothetical protein [Thermales bacterium]